MCEGYGSCCSTSECVYMCMCVSVAALATTFFEIVCMSKVRQHRVPCWLLKICII